MDLLLRGASLIDGTGAPARPADVAVDGERIVGVDAPGRLTPTHRTEVIDLDGLALAPGFIDVHTHYDAQILWDGDLTPSSWHGVTSVVMGNCGFGVAPTRPEHRDIIVRTFENVEGMSMDALNEGIDWCFETFPEYLTALDQRRKRINVGAFVGHSTLRLFVVGPEERAATPEEVSTMRTVLAGGHAAGRDRVLDLAPTKSSGRVRPTGAEPLRRCGGGVRAHVGAGRARQGGRGGLHRSGAVRRPVLRDGGQVRSAGDVDGAGGAGGQARRGAADGRARRRPARRGLPADRLPPDRHADEPGRPHAARRDRRVEGGAGPTREPSAAASTGIRHGATGPARRRWRPGAIAGRRSTWTRRRLTTIFSG